MSARRRKLIAVAAMIAFNFLLQVYVHADLAKESKKKATTQPTNKKQISGQLATIGRMKILVNGNNTPSGACIFSGSQIQTPDSVGAAIMVGSLGRVEIAPKTTLLLDFTSESMEVSLTAGGVLPSTNHGVCG